jgi:hypothetical protein
VELAFLQREEQRARVSVPRARIARFEGDIKKSLEYQWIWRLCVRVVALEDKDITLLFSVCSTLWHLMRTMLCQNHVFPPKYLRIRHIYIRQPFFRLLPISLIPILILFSGPTITKASTIHSYQTFLSSVCLQILTSNSASSGK